MSGQGRGTATSPPAGSMSLPYVDSFGGYRVGDTAKYLAQQQGDFQSQPCRGGRTGTCMRQMADQTPIFWGQNGAPSAALGDLGWSNYTVSVKVLLEQAGTVHLAGRIRANSATTARFH